MQAFSQNSPEYFNVKHKKHKPNQRALHRKLLTTVMLPMEDVSRMLTPHLRHFQQQNKAGPSHTISKNKRIKRIAFQRCKTWVLFLNSKIRCVRLVTLGHVANRASAAFLRLKCQSCFYRGENRKANTAMSVPQHPACTPPLETGDSGSPAVTMNTEEEGFQQTVGEPFDIRRA